MWTTYLSNVSKFSLILLYSSRGTGSWSPTLRNSSTTLKKSLETSLDYLFRFACMKTASFQASLHFPTLNVKRDTFSYQNTPTPSSEAEPPLACDSISCEISSSIYVEWNSPCLLLNKEGKPRFYLLCLLDVFHDA